jgi:hypothetical protein
MWLAVAIVLGSLGVATAIMRSRARAGRRQFEAGTLSDSWLAQHRSTKDD